MPHTVQVTRSAKGPRLRARHQRPGFRSGKGFASKPSELPLDPWEGLSRLCTDHCGTPHHPRRIRACCRTLAACVRATLRAGLRAALAASVSASPAPYAEQPALCVLRPLATAFSSVTQREHFGFLEGGAVLQPCPQRTPRATPPAAVRACLRPALAAAALDSPVPYAERSALCGLQP